MREDRFSNTPDQAAAYEARRGQDTYDDPRPSLAEAIRDECAHLHQSDVADFDAWPPPAARWVCSDCGAGVR